MPAERANPYDQVAYASHALPQTHPDRLATLATLFGLRPAPVGRCRVLELGCGDGSNLIPMAYALPDSDFTGIDLAAEPIARGCATIEALALRNVALRHLDVMDVDASLGQFDYIIAHGLYSWVPPAVQDRILAICAANLAPGGVAYVSYNAYPGGHLRDMVRGMMRFHVQHVGDRDEPVGEARALLGFLANAQPEGDAYGSLLRTELQRITDSSEGYVFHDDLADINAPVYFHEFVARAAGHGLQYLAEADYFEMQDAAFMPAVAQALRHVAGGERILQEQYADFLKCRKFRQTLLCHASHALSAITDLAPFSLASSAATRASPKQLASATAAVEFRDRSGRSMTTNHPLLKAAMVCLAEAWPEAVGFAELLERASQRAKVAATGDLVALLSEMLLKVYARDLVSLHVWPPRFARTCGELPRASALARLQAGQGSRVTNLRHDNVELNGPVARHLVQMLDGTRTRQELLAGLAAGPDADGGASTTRTPPASVVAELEQKLAELAKLALIEA